MADGEPSIFTFGEFTVDGTKRLLLKGDGEPVQLSPKVFDLLFYLAQHAGQTVSKDTLMSEIWPDTIVEEGNLSQNIFILRKILGEQRAEHKYIATVPGTGYKFVTDVHPLRREEEDVADNLHLPGQAVKPSKGSRSIFIALLSLVSIGLMTAYYFWQKPVGGGSALNSIAVLPFKPIGAGERDEALEMGMADTLISRLDNIKEIRVRPLTSVRRFGGPEQDALEAGRALGVDSVLDGSIQHSGEKMRVNVRLIRVSDGSPIWGAIYDEKFTDIFNIQDLIARKVAESLKIRFAASGASVVADRGQTKNPDAYRLYLQGRYSYHKLTQPDVRRGIQFFQEAIDADPTYALAYAGMADAYRSLPINSDVPSADAMPQAKAAALKALELDPENADAHNVLGYIASWYDHDWMDAENQFNTALQLSPNNPDAHRGYSILVTCLGRNDEAISHMATARELDPLSLVTSTLEGQTLFFAGKYGDAIARLNKTLEIQPNFWVAHVLLARIYIQQGKYDIGLAEAEKARQFSNGNSDPISMAGYAKARLGRTGDAAKDLETLKSLRTQGFAVDYNTAMLYNGLGYSDEAIETLKKAFDVRDVRLILLKVDPKWDNLRADARFVDLMKQMNFE